MRDDFDGFKPEKPIEWYLARDGQQFGPLSDVEMIKFKELGHLRSTDMVWRDGYADWRPAGEVFDLKSK